MWKNIGNTIQDNAFLKIYLTLGLVRCREILQLWHILELCISLTDITKKKNTHVCVECISEEKMIF